MTNSVRSTLRKSFLARDHPMNFFHGGAAIDKKRKGDSLQGDDKRRKTTRPGYFQGAQAMSGAFYRISRKRLVENVNVFLACQIDDGRCDFNTVYKKPRNFSEGKAEWRALSTLDHPNIVPLLDTVEAFRNEHVAFFLPYYRHKDVFEHWTESRENPMPLSWFRQIAEAVAHAHTKGFAHRDIKMENVFLKEGEGGTRIPILGDWGHSTDATTATECLGTVDYMAPELRTDCHRTNPYDPKRVDAWAMGILFLHMYVFTGTFRGVSQTPELNKALYGGKEPDMDALWSFCKRNVPSQCREVPKTHRHLVTTLLVDRAPMTEVVGYVKTMEEETHSLNGGAKEKVTLRTGKSCGHPDKKFCATVGNKKVFFGQAGASDYTIHKTPTRMLDYVRRHGGKYHGDFDRLRTKPSTTIHKQLLQVKASSKENWSDPRTAGFWSRWLLWSYPDLNKAKRHIESHFNIQFVKQSERRMEGGGKKKSPLSKP